MREKIKYYVLRAFYKIRYRGFPEIPVEAAAKLWGVKEPEINPICEKEGHDALYIKNKYRDIGIVHHQITPCKRCGKGNGQ